MTWLILAFVIVVALAIIAVAAGVGSDLGPGEDDNNYD